MGKEAAELSTRTDALSKFMDGDVFQTLGDAEQEDMASQLEAMILYRRALNHRIDRAAVAQPLCHCGRRNMAIAKGEDVCKDCGGAIDA